jgi:hypothetical protein
MNTKIKRILLVFFALVLIGVSLLLAFGAQRFYMKLLNINFNLASVIGEKAEYKKFGDLYNHLLYLGLALSFGISFIIMFWDQAIRWEKRAIIYIIFLFILIPLSLLNYWSEDIFFDRWKQALVDLIIVLFGVFTYFNVNKIQTLHNETKVLKFVALFLIVTQAILIPGIYSLLWFFDWQNLISSAKKNDTTANWITYSTSISGIILSVLNYRHAIKKDNILLQQKSRS